MAGRKLKVILPIPYTEYLLKAKNSPRLSDIEFIGPMSPSTSLPVQFKHLKRPPDPITIHPELVLVRLEPSKETA